MHRGLNSASPELKHLVPLVFLWGSVGFALCPACGVQPFPPAPRSSAIAQDFSRKETCCSQVPLEESWASCAALAEKFCWAGTVSLGCRGALGWLLQWFPASLLPPSVGFWIKSVNPGSPVWWGWWFGVISCSSDCSGRSSAAQEGQLWGVLSKQEFT